MYCTHRGADKQQSKASCGQCGKCIGGSAPEERMTVRVPSRTENISELLERNKR
jgi:uncharacterized membrane protein YvbJ